MASDEELLANHLSVSMEWVEQDDFGDPVPGAEPVDPALIESFRGRLPTTLLQIWERYGFAGFSDGLLWWVNPNDYSDIVNWWIKDTPFANLDTYHTIGRGPFGSLLLWAERSCETIKLNVPHGLSAVGVERLKAGPHTELRAAGRFVPTLLTYGPTKTPPLSGLDLANSNGTSLFRACVERHGPLERSQVFGFAPYLFLGGDIDINNINVVDEFVQLELIKQFLDKPLFKDITHFPG